MKEQIQRLLNWRTALGELIIIVVGILIALTIDSWWEERENRIEETAHITSLKAEVEVNLIELYSVIASTNQYTISTRTLIKIIDGHQDTPSSDTLKELIWDSFSYSAYSPLLTTYDNLLSTGGIQLLQDEKLKLDLARFKASIDILDKDNWAYDYMVQQISPWADMNLGFDLLPETFRNRHQLPEPNVKTDWIAILSDQKFKGIILSRLIGFSDFMDGLNEILPAAEALAEGLGMDVEEIHKVR